MSRTNNGKESDGHFKDRSGRGETYDNRNVSPRTHRDREFERGPDSSDGRDARGSIDNRQDHSTTRWGDAPGDYQRRQERPTSVNSRGPPRRDDPHSYMEDDEEAEETTGTEPVEVESTDEDEDDDDDMFATLGVSGPAVSLASTGEEDILAAFMDDDEESQEAEVEEESKSPEPVAQPGAMDAYRMVLDTVWVDGILDPGEVNLLARKREDLGISFEEHLAIVRDMLG